MPPGPLLDASFVNVLTTRPPAESDIILLRVQLLVAYQALAFHGLAVLLETLFEELRLATYQVLVDREVPFTAM